MGFMKLPLIIIMMSFCALPCFAQDELDNYLKGHHHGFSLDSGFEQGTIDLLKQKLSNYRVVIVAEGGSHFLQFYEPLAFVWLRLLHDHFGMTHHFLETGHSFDVVANHYLQTGDTTYLPARKSARTKNVLAALYNYNKVQPEGKKLIPLGIDFESANSYCRALKLLIPNREPPANIKNSIDLIRTSNDTLNSCDYIKSVNTRLKDALKMNRESFRQYLATRFYDFEWIVMNNGSCADVRKDRNRHMAENFLSFDKKFNDRFYYGQLGMAHTLLSNNTTAFIINSSEGFKNQVCVVNTYCYNCTTKEEAVSNWQLRKIEKDILDRLLKYCISDFTLFDFTGDHEATKKFRSLGQFLIIAKNQQ
jgi:hypothetical protein